MSTWPSDGLQENESEEELVKVTVRLLTAAGPGHRKEAESQMIPNSTTGVYVIVTHAFVPLLWPLKTARHHSVSPPSRGTTSLISDRADAHSDSLREVSG